MPTRNKDLRLGLLGGAKMIAAVAVALPLAWGAMEAGGRTLARFEPDTERAYNYFRADYERADDRSAFLSGYREHLWEHGGGYTPQRADRFLCKRLQQAPQAEALAIADFYAAQACGREGTRITHLDAPVRERVVGLLLSRVGGYNSAQAHGALVLIEELRTGQELFKGGIGLERGDYRPDWPAWWKRDGLPRARRAFQVWWRRDEPWATKSKRNPLAGSGLEAHGL